MGSVGKPKGGSKSGGRKKGVPNKATAARAEAIAKSGLTPLDYMLEVMRDKKADAGIRLEAAKAAAPYVHPKLTSVTLHGNNDDGSFTFNVHLTGADARA